MARRPSGVRADPARNLVLQWLTRNRVLRNLVLVSHCRAGSCASLWALRTLFLLLRPGKTTCTRRVRARSAWWGISYRGETERCPKWQLLRGCRRAVASNARERVGPPACSYRGQMSWDQESHRPQ